jgi:hypothetical protein
LLLTGTLWWRPLRGRILWSARSRSSRYLDTRELTVTLRRTQKLARALPATSDNPPPPDTALGDWFVNRILVDRRPLLLLVASETLLPILIPARDVSTLPARLPELVAARLRRARVPEALIAAEIAAMAPIGVSKTANASIMGVVVDFGYAVETHLPIRAWDETTLPFVEAAISETPCFASRRVGQVIVPELDSPTALADRWGAR